MSEEHGVLTVIERVEKENLPKIPNLWQNLSQIFK